ncbi:AraC family transcriptional regulator [Vibrio fluvialis]|jgi:AraC-like DNA-binding protein|uniref:AraC family transcriptional regulator n=1 Tax=Vibrio fluvialis TaxID=676 RepID=A0AAX2LX22_VIBFL|nr:MULTISPECIES: AraC family transcriptional regulator [Vibrio]TNF16586.1 MAG: AraC family transcriptional regulator [Vibrionaceae bacterium]AMF93320.1 AraC family transcriptional regulator [Vibrio fluvialis]AVH33525.1 AraC family transcriptional regulator [Vibrio fluvialis]EKO3366905.1 AraC family transcriptional regulator [Vibrio fluvialis]EKO3373280.1 AraC family transcriptional regulator [Vibrio fluvialis]
MSTLSSHNPSILEQRAKLLSPRPAELVTLPSHMHCHDHSYTQIVIGLKGQAEFEVSGMGNIVGPGQGCVVTSGSDHAFGGIIGQSDILVLNMPLPSNDDPLMLQKINDLSNADVYFQLDGQIQKLVQMLVQEMQNSPEDMLLSRACSDTVLALLQRHISAFETHRRESRFDLEAIDRYIEQHISSRISVAQLAGSVFLGESQFHMLFKEQMGITPHQYVLGKRVDMAKLMIEQGRLTLGQIAELSGFSNQSTFTHTFSRLQGVSPSQYKKMCRN